MYIYIYCWVIAWRGWSMPALHWPALVLIRRLAHRNHVFFLIDWRPDHPLFLLQDALINSSNIRFIYSVRFFASIHHRHLQPLLPQLTLTMISSNLVSASTGAIFSKMKKRSRGPEVCWQHGAESGPSCITPCTSGLKLEWDSPESCGHCRRDIQRVSETPSESLVWRPTDLVHRLSHAKECQLYYVSWWCCRPLNGLPTYSTRESSRQPTVEKGNSRPPRGAVTRDWRSWQGAGGLSEPPGRSGQ